MREVPASEFTRNFGWYREIAQREPIAVTHHGRTTGYFVSAVEFEEIQRIKTSSRRSRAAAEIMQDQIEQLTATRASSGNAPPDAQSDKK
jgi:PHD/YefM family antitoxin component YafN of YafNO toxin-antitoxin module